MLYTEPFTAKHRDYLKIVLASKRVKLTLEPWKDKKKILSANINSEEMPGDRPLRHNALKANVEVDEEEEFT